MDLDPVIVEVKPPKTPFKLPFKLPKLPLGNTPRTTKIIAAVAAVVIVISMVLVLVFTVLANSSSYKKAHNITNATDEIAINTQAVKSDDALPGGSSVMGKGGTTGTNSPEVTLSASQASVTKGEKVKLTWSVTNNPKSCVASEDWSGEKPAKGSEDSIALTNLQTYLFTLTCKTDTGTGFSTVSVSAIEQGGTGIVGARPEVTLAPADSQVTVGKATTLSWSVTNSPTSCTANDDWSGLKNAEGSASTGVLGSIRSYKFTLTCVNSSGTGYASATVDVTAPLPNLPEVFITSSIDNPVLLGSSPKLTWSSTNNPSSCTATGDWAGAQPASGVVAVGPLNSIREYTFKLTCGNAAGTGFEIIIINVLPAIPSVSITPALNTITMGGSTTINWSATSNPTSCTATGGTGTWAGAKTGSSGAVSTGTINTQGTYTYYMTCANQAGTSATASTTVTVNPPPIPVVTLNITPTAVTTGGSATISWSVTNNPTSCTPGLTWAGTGNKTNPGTASTGILNTAGTYSYSLTCTNAGGSGSATTSVSVANAGAPVVAPVVTISATPATIGTNGSSTINWSVSGTAGTCTASGGWSGIQSMSGSFGTGALATTTSYTLACTNSAGTDTKSTTVTVVPPPVVTLTLNPTSINTGGTTSITWNATNTPTSCTAGGGNGTFSGSKAASGTITSNAMSPAGTYPFTMTCTNAGGSTTATATLTVTDVAVVYCGGNGTVAQPCMNLATIQTHNTNANCWAYQRTGTTNIYVVYNLTGFATRHSGGSAVILTTPSMCGSQINWTGAPSNAKHSAAQTNTQATLTSYRVGWYDPLKP